MSTTPIQQCIQSMALGLRPDPIMLVSAWAETHRIMNSAYCSAPGRWKNARTPYLVDPMNDLSAHSSVKIEILMFGSQLGKTETGVNWLGYIIDNSPAPSLFMQPTADAARDFVQGRLDHVIEDVKALNDKVDDPEKRHSKNTLKSKHFPGGVIYIRGANSPVGFASTPIKYRIFDECDRWPHDVGGEGSPLTLGRQRSTNFFNDKELLTSTPTIRGGSIIEREFLHSRKHYRLVPCPHCGAFDILKFQQLKWPKGHPEQAEYVCEHCGCYIEERHKEQMLADGFWWYAGPWMFFDKQWRDEIDLTGEKIPIPEGQENVIGRHMNSLYSPLGWLSWAELAAEWERAKHDPLVLKSFVNTKLAETFTLLSDGETPDNESLIARVESFDTLPDEVILITAGVDVQGDRLEVEVKGWGLEQESWSLEYLVIDGDPDGQELWDTLGVFLKSSIHGLPISAACIDSGYMTDRVYAFCKPRRKDLVWPVKGASDKYDFTRPVWPRKATPVSRGTVNLQILGVNQAKEVIAARLAKTDPGPGFMHFGQHCDAGYFTQLTSETLKKVFVDGLLRRHWVKRAGGAANEVLDINVYAYAALLGWLSTGRTLEQEAAKVRHRREIEAGKRAPTQAKKRQPSIKRPPRGWLKR